MNEMGNLYHYTNVGGFEGIISNNSIRMTKSDFLNDPTDCHLFVALIDRYIKSHPKIFSEIISSVKNYGDIVERIYEKNGCDLIHYVEYIHQHVSLYVMSLTQIDDGMNMWNYYGQGGMELNFSMESLIKSLQKTFISEKEFLAEAHVIYANNEFDVEKIDVPTFADFTLINKESNNIFEDHRSFINGKSYYEAAQLYSTTRLDQFINTYMKSYISTLEYLLKKKEISENMSSEMIFGKVFDNVSKLNNFYYWKHDLSLYMLVLSALIKSDTYEYEDEHRVVYFEYDINSEKTKKEEYTVKHIMSGDFICPYITFKKDDGNDLLQSSLKGITISPVTRNLPINNDTYLKTLNKYILSKGFTDVENIQYSKHTIRW